MNIYKVLNKQNFILGRYTLVPIRFEDRYDILKWRNEQIYHLRQVRPLTQEDQDGYFENVVAKLFEQDQPNQILFSFLEDGVCIGYGGLVHINYIDKNAEISFIMDTSLEKERFQELWLFYLKLIEEVAFISLSFHKIYTYAFDLRPQLYDALYYAHFVEDSRLKEHAIFNDRVIDVVIHSKTNQQIQLVPVSENDIEVTFKWTSDKKVRQFSFNKGKIYFNEHKTWLLNKINDPNCYYYILQRGAEKIGSIRIDFYETNKKGLISYLIASDFHGNGYGTCMLMMVENIVKTKFEVIYLTGLVMKSNKASVRIFNKSGYDLISDQEDILTFSKTIKR